MYGAVLLLKALIKAKDILQSHVNRRKSTSTSRPVKVETIQKKDEQLFNSPHPERIPQTVGQFMDMPAVLFLHMVSFLSVESRELLSLENVCQKWKENLNSSLAETLQIWRRVFHFHEWDIHLLPFSTILDNSWRSKVQYASLLDQSWNTLQPKESNILPYVSHLSLVENRLLGATLNTIFIIDMDKKENKIEKFNSTLLHPITAITQSFNQQFIAIGLTDNSIRICKSTDSSLSSLSDNENKSPYETRFILNDHTQSTTCLHFLEEVDNSSSGSSGSTSHSNQVKKLLSSSLDFTIKEWDLETEKCLRTLRSHRKPISSFGINYSDQIIVSGSDDRWIKRWDLRTGGCIHSWRGHSAGIRGVHVDNKRVITASEDSTIRVWALTGSRCLRILEGHHWDGICMSVYGRRIVSASMDSPIQIWDADSGHCIRVLNQTKKITALQSNSHLLLTSEQTDEGGVIAREFLPS